MAVKVLFNKGELARARCVCASMLMDRASASGRLQHWCHLCVFILRHVDHTASAAAVLSAATSHQPSSLDLPDETMHELQAEAAVMIRMR